MERLTLEDLEAVAAPEILARGREYWINGQVRAALADRNSLSATVVGALGDYRVRLFRRDGRLGGQCECPYKNGFCKHSAAVAWGWLNEPERFLSLGKAAERAERMSRRELVKALMRLAAQDPQGVAEVLGLTVTKTILSVSALERLTDNIGRGDPASPDWLKAWRRVLELASSGDTADKRTAGVLERLIGYGAAHFRAEKEPSAEFYSLFTETLERWAQAAEQDAVPSWWEAVFAVYREARGDKRLQLAQRLVSALAEARGAQLLQLIGYPPVKEAEFWDVVCLAVGLVRRTGEKIDPLLAWALETLERTLELMDAFSDWEAWDWLKKLSREGIRRFPPENWQIFRSRQASAHLALGEPRQALALLLTNFKERPGWEEYLLLRRVAEQANETERVRKEVRSALEAKGKWELLAKVLLQEADLERLIAVVPYLDPAKAFLEEVAGGLRFKCPHLSRELWERRIHHLISQGTRKAVRDAVPPLAALKRLCREEGWRKEWEVFRSKILEAVTDPVALRITGSLLSQEE